MQRASQETVPNQPNVEGGEVSPLLDAEIARAQQLNTEGEFSVATSHEILAERILAQEPRLIEASKKIAATVSQLSPCEACVGQQPKALIIGGFVRDAALGLQPKDLDMEIYGISSEQLEATLEELFPSSVHYCGKSFGVFKVSLGDGLDLDISLPRKERSTGPKSSDFEIVSAPELSIYDAASRRDFTMNTISFDPLTGQVWDEHGGLNDLREQKLKITNETQFQEDPLRVYRAVQFSARMNLELDNTAENLLRMMIERGDLIHLPAERVQEEFTKLLLKSPQPSIGFNMMRDLGILQKYFPEINALWKTPQDPEWHPEGDAGIHTMLVVDAAAKLIRHPGSDFTHEEKLTIMLGALCHDLGKPSTTKLDEETGRLRSLGHDNAGVEPTLELLEKLKYPKALQKAVAAITKYHMQPGAEFRKLEQGKMDYKTFVNNTRRLMRSSKAVDFDLLLTVCEADSRGRDIEGVDTEPFTVGELMRSASIFFGLSPANLLEGKDLQELGIPEGVQYGKIIQEVEARRNKGKLQTKEEGLHFVRMRHLLKSGDVLKLGVESGIDIGRIMKRVKDEIKEGKISTRKDALAYLHANF